jgi:hypothetical protein
MMSTPQVDALMAPTKTGYTGGGSHSSQTDCPSYISSLRRKIGGPDGIHHHSRP